jgi:gamma-glutamyl hercynylcysteine S-oxide synthase
MHSDSLTAARFGTVGALAEALLASRADTLATFAAFEAALPGLKVPQRPELNPPLWELGHIGWFQAFWIARNPQCALGTAADPEVPRSPAARPDAEALYHSSRVPHASRWSLPLPDADATRSELAAQLQQTLARLRDASPDDAGLYFFRLALLHEDMHHEAALYMAQSLGVPIDDPRWQPLVLPEPPAPLHFEASTWRLGHDGPGFAFDNERGAHEVPVAACRIDAQVLRWAEYLPFVEAGGGAVPRYLRRAGRGWQRWRHGRWEALPLEQAACHLTQAEALAWCRWAGRRLPTEAEWERAAVSTGADFRWGDVWEWTVSPFAPYPGFEPHPYRDYSAPWFDGRPVLRGASFLTQPRMRHPRYRNFFLPQRSDIPAGLRTCAD